MMGEVYMEVVNFNEKLLIHDIDGHRIFLDTNDLHMSIHMLENGVWEPQIRKIICASLNKDGVYVDVGANIGLHAVYAAGLVGSKGKVYAIEPNNQVYNILKTNMDINGFFDRAVLYNIAISNANENSKLYIYNGHAGGSGLGKEVKYKTDYIEQKVSTSTLDLVLEGQKVDVLKIDVEGFEANVIGGALSVLASNPDITIIMEWHPKEMEDK